jgi:hypothetical protein
MDVYASLLSAPDGFHTIMDPIEPVGMPATTSHTVEFSCTLLLTSYDQEEEREFSCQCSLLLRWGVADALMGGANSGIHRSVEQQPLKLSLIFCAVLPGLLLTLSTLVLVCQVKLHSN